MDIDDIEIGTLMHLQGITLKGKNRINRGGISWMVKFKNRTFGLCMQSVQKGEHEMFWMLPKNDPHVRRINGQ